MPKSFRTQGGLSRFEEKVISRAAANEDRLKGVLNRATSGPGVGQETRPRAVGDELLAGGDPVTRQRTAEMGPHLSPDERKAVNRRVLRQGGEPVFPEDGI